MIIDDRLFAVQREFLAGRITIEELRQQIGQIRQEALSDTEPDTGDAPTPPRPEQ